MIRSLHLALACIASFFLATSHLAQRGVRLNGPIVYGIVGDVTLDQLDRLTLSPDSAWTVYRADGETDNVFELYSVPTAGGPVRRISAPMVPGERIDGYAITADSARVVFRVYTSVSWPLHRLYSVPIDGSSEAVELAPHVSNIQAFGVDQASSRVIFNSGSNILAAPIDGSSAPTALVNSGLSPASFEHPFFALSPDGSRAVFHVVSPGLAIELFSRPSDGSAPGVRLSFPISSPRRGVANFLISDAGTKVVYVADQDTAGVYELYAAPIDASAPPAKLNGPIVAGGDIGGIFGEDFAFDPTGTRVVYLADQDSDGRNELYSSNLVSAASNVRLNGALVVGGNVTGFTISPSGGRVLYRANQLAVGDFGLFSAPIDGSTAPTALYAPAGEDVGTFLAASDESAVVFQTLTSGGVPAAVWRVPFAGGPAVRLTPPNFEPRGGIALLPDLSTVLSRGRFQPLTEEQLHAVPMDGSQTLTQLNTPHGLSEVEDFAVAPDGSLAIFLADQSENDCDELYSVPTDGSAPDVKLNAPLAHTLTPQGNVLEFRITSDGAHAVYQADEDEIDTPELYSVSTSGSQPPVKLNGPLTNGGGVFFDFLLSSDAQRVLYRSDQDGPHAEVYSVPIDHSTAPIKLTGPMVAGGDVAYPFFMTPDDSRLLYQADQSVDGVRELFSTPTDGSAAPTRLHPPLGGVQDVFEWHPSTDGARAVFSANLDDDTTVELYSAPIDGSSAPLKLNGPMTAGGDLFLGLRVGDERVVYGADQDTDGVTEAYSAPVDGSGPAVKLNGSLVVDGDSVGAAISANTVVYLADQTTDEVIELYGVPADGSSAAVRLNGTLVSGGDVTGATISPDGQWVVYRADQLVNNRFELFGAPTDGSAPAIRLSPTTTFNVSDGFKITPDGVHVLFLEKVGAVTNLYSAPIDGSAPALRLNPVLSNGRQVTAFGLDPFGRVLYVADQDALARYELYRVPADGSEAARRVNRRFGPSAGMATAGLNPAFAYTPSGNEVLYISDQQTDSTFELFATFLDGDKKLQVPTPTSPVEVQTLAVSAARGQNVLDLPAATISYFEDERGSRHGQNVFRDHEELARLGIHPALQDDTGAMVRLPPEASAASRRSSGSK